MGVNLKKRAPLKIIYIPLVAFIVEVERFQQYNHLIVLVISKTKISSYSEVLQEFCARPRMYETLWKNGSVGSVPNINETRLTGPQHF